MAKGRTTEWLMQEIARLGDDSEVGEARGELESLWKEYISLKVREDPRWAMRALMALYREQTPDERDAERTVHHNDVGFNGADAGILTSMAKQLEERGTLSARQVDVLYRALPKYAGQLARIASRR